MRKSSIRYAAWSRSSLYLDSHTLIWVSLKSDQLSKPMVVYCSLGNVTILTHGSLSLKIASRCATLESTTRGWARWVQATGPCSRTTQRKAQHTWTLSQWRCCSDWHVMRGISRASYGCHSIVHLAATGSYKHTKSTVSTLTAFQTCWWTAPLINSIHLTGSNTYCDSSIASKAYGIDQGQ